MTKRNLYFNEDRFYKWLLKRYKNDEMLKMITFNDKSTIIGIINHLAPLCGQKDIWNNRNFESIYTTESTSTLNLFREIGTIDVSDFEIRK